MGLESAEANLSGLAGELRGSSTISAFQDAALIVEAEAKRNAPVDTGRLRASIHSEVSSNVLTGKITATVGSEVPHAAVMETGSGTFNNQPPHHPPSRALAVWARRHGVNPYLVARAIYRRGGLRPRRYLQRAKETTEPRVVRLIGKHITTIVNRYNGN